MPSTHAYLPASAAHRWMECTASPRLEATIPDRGSSFAAEGTMAHAMAEEMLKEHLEDGYIGNVCFEEAEMAENVQTYVDYCLEILNREKAENKAADFAIEKRLDLQEWIPKGFGTADFIVAGNHLHVIDLKYGKGVRVEAPDNPQLKLYALGAVMEYGWLYDFSQVTVHIVQPRLDHISTATYSVLDLQEWGSGEVKAKAFEAYHGPGVIHPGEHCRFCRYRSECTDRQQALIDQIEKAKANTQLTGYVLEHAAEWEAWLRETKENALQKALDGEQIPGFKLVEGRSNRKISNPDRVAGILRLEGFDPDKPRELKTLTALEKEVGKKRFQELCGKYIYKPEGKPTLVPESDKRPALNSVETMFKILEE